MEELLFTSKSVTEEHPDKVYDQTSDVILDALLGQDLTSRMVCEAVVTIGLVMVVGGVTTHVCVDMQKIIQEIVREVGYDRTKYEFSCDTCDVIIAIDGQSTDTALGADKALEAKEHTMSEAEIDVIDAGDQGMMSGLASNGAEECMFYPTILAHRLTRQLAKVRKDRILGYLCPDGRTQVTVECSEDGRPIRLDAVVLSTQHDESVTQEWIHEGIHKHVFDVVLSAKMVDEETKLFINLTGRFVTGGPHRDSGLAGHKIIVNAYDGYARHGGDVLSGKDCTKVDRSAAYAARYVAKNTVAVDLADKCEIQLSYVTGVAHPIPIMADTFDTGRVTNGRLVETTRENFDLRPAGIIKMLDLRRPVYKQTTAYGRFGRNDLELPWEKLDKTETLKKYL